MTPAQKPKYAWDAIEEEALDRALDDLHTLVQARRICPSQVEEELGNLRMRHEQKLRSNEYRREQGREDDGDMMRKEPA